MRASSSPQSDSQFTDVDGLRVRFFMQALAADKYAVAAFAATHTQGLES